MALGSDKSIFFPFPVDLPTSNKMENIHAIPHCHIPACLGLFDHTIKFCEGIV